MFYIPSQSRIWQDPAHIPWSRSRVHARSSRCSRLRSGRRRGHGPPVGHPGRGRRAGPGRQCRGRRRRGPGGDLRRAAPGRRARRRRAGAGARPRGGRGRERDRVAARASCAAPAGTTGGHVSHRPGPRGRLGRRCTRAGADSPWRGVLAPALALAARRVPARPEPRRRRRPAARAPRATAAPRDWSLLGPPSRGEAAGRSRSWPPCSRRSRTPGATPSTPGRPRIALVEAVRRGGGWLDLADLAAHVTPCPDARRRRVGRRACARPAADVPGRAARHGAAEGARPRGRGSHRRRPRPGRGHRGGLRAPLDVRARARSPGRGR